LAAPAVGHVWPAGEGVSRVVAIGPQAALDGQREIREELRQATERLDAAKKQRLQGAKKG
jgi:hypothetical protein